MRRLCGPNFYVGCMGYVGQNMFYMGHNFYVRFMGQIYSCVGQNSCVGQFVFCGSKSYRLNFLRGSKFLHGSTFWGWV